MEAIWKKRYERNYRGNKTHVLLADELTYMRGCDEMRLSGACYRQNNSHSPEKYL